MSFFQCLGVFFGFFLGYQEAFRTLKSADSEAVKQNGLSLQFAHPDVRADADVTGFVDTLWPVFVDNPLYIYYINIYLYRYLLILYIYIS